LEAIVRLDAKFRLRSPRHYLRKHHFPEISFWRHARSLPDGIADHAYMAFLNFPRHIFNDIAEQIRPHVPAYDPYNWYKGGGRVPKVDYVDLTALGLRALRVVGGQSRLMIDFAMPQPAVSKFHAIARPVIAYVARTWALAEIRMATPDEGRSMWETLIAQHGLPDIVRPAFEGLAFCYTLDGVVIPMLDCSNQEISDHWYSFNKGRCMKYVLLWNTWGLICNYSIGWPGSCYDAKAAEDIFEDLQSVETNPGRLGTIADVAFEAFCRAVRCTSGDPGRGSFAGPARPGSDAGTT